MLIINNMKCVNEILVGTTRNLKKNEIYEEKKNYITKLIQFQ